MGLFDRLFGRKPQTTPAPVNEPKEEVQETAPEMPVEAVSAAPVAEVAAPAAEAVAVSEDGISEEALQRKLDRYFARLREIYPDGVVTRLNTGHKKLAERGAQLRHLTGDEGDLDAFFARGGFTYQRTKGGRPSAASADNADLVARVKAAFPQGVPTAMALRDADHRLYLDLRAIARREETTVGAWLTAHQLMK